MNTRVASLSTWTVLSKFGDRFKKSGNKPAGRSITAAGFRNSRSRHEARSIMRPQDKAVFSEAAKEFGLWILVRRTNPASFRYVGQPGYVPKPLDCKAKTADVSPPGRVLAGLVVDPTLVPQAFSASRINSAKTEWAKYGKGMITSGRYKVDDKDPKSQTYGLVRLHGDFLHGDYDLFDIIDPAQACRNLAAVETMLEHPHNRGRHFFKVQRFINGRIGVDMIQHGGEMQFADHSEQPVDAFGPNGEIVTILNKHSVIEWYQSKFHGRKPVGS